MDKQRKEQKGCIHIYCGDGKGKTTAALGLALRAAGRGKKVMIARFLKSDDSGEVPLLQQIPGIRLKPCSKCFGFYSQMTDEQKKEAKVYYKQLFRDTWKETAEEAYDMVILDEPFSGLDPVNSQILKDVVNELINDKRLVIFSSHQMSYVEEFCDNIAIINQGQVVLDGQLKDIKKEYSRNRLMLAAENHTLEELARKVEGEWQGLARVSGRKKEFLVLELSEGADKRAFLERLAKSDVDVEKFGRYEPSLNDIFVAKVGEEE